MIETRENFKKTESFRNCNVCATDRFKETIAGYQNVVGLMKCGNITADILTTLLVLCINIYVVSPTSKLNSTYNYVTNKYS